MIGAEEARAAAAAARDSPSVRIEPRFTAFEHASIGAPVLVHDLSLHPSYWLAPVCLEVRVIGFVRVLLDGRVTAVGSMCGYPAQSSDCPEVVTWISADEAAERAGRQLDAAAGERARPPIYVHDGPPGREAWLVATDAPDGRRRWIFVTGSEIYERPAGERRDEALE